MDGTEELRLQEKELFDAFDFKSIELNIQSGVLRVGGNFNFDNSDVTLALFSARKPAIITVPQGCSLHLEALTESTFSITEATSAEPTHDLNQWLINLHLVLFGGDRSSISTWCFGGDRSLINLHIMVLS